MHWTQIFLAAALTIYLGAFAAILVAVKLGTGTSPRGHPLPVARQAVLPTNHRMGDLACWCAADFVAARAVFVIPPQVIPGQAGRSSHTRLVATETILSLHHSVGHRWLSGDGPHDNQECYQD